MTKSRSLDYLDDLTIVLFNLNDLTMYPNVKGQLLLLLCLLLILGFKNRINSQNRNVYSAYNPNEFLDKLKLMPDAEEEAEEAYFNFAADYARNIAFAETTRHNNFYTIDAEIDGIKGRLIIDTGSSGIVLNSKYFNGTRSNETLHSFTGKRKVKVSRINKMKIGGMEFKNLHAFTSGLQNIENNKGQIILGLLGYDFLRNYEVQLNFRSGHIVIHELDKEGNRVSQFPNAPKIIDSIEMEVFSYIPAINVELNGQKRVFGIDTGAEYNILHAKRTDKTEGIFRKTDKIWMIGANGHREEHDFGKILNLKFGNKYPCPQLNTVKLNMDEFNKTYGPNLDGILGQNFLAPWVLSINYKKKKIYVHEFIFVMPEGY